MASSNIAVLLRSLISEVIKVTVQQFSDEDPSKPVGRLDPREYSDDDMEELMYQLNRLDFKPLQYEKQKRKKKKEGEEDVEVEKKRLTAGSARDVDSIISTLTARKGGTTDPSVVAEQEALSRRLHDVIEPWGQAGYEALLRVLTYTINTGKEFPFFSQKSVSVGSSIAFPYKAASQALVDALLDVKTRIGRNATGKGELLLTLMTGGMPPKGPGDIAIAGQPWEMKDARGTNVVRLGGVVSQDFVKRATAWASMPQNAGLLDPQTLAEIRSAKDMDPRLRSEMTLLIRAALEAQGLAGIILVRNGRFDVHSLAAAEFYSINNENRVHVKMPPSVESSGKSSGD